MLRVLFAALLIPLTASCVTTGLRPDNQDGPVYHINYTSDDAYRNKTHVTFSAGHGVQVEYHSRGGNTFLWYPGNAKTVRGNWKTITPHDSSLQLCYKYSAKSYNPLTQRYGGGWQCRHNSQALNRIKYICDGDRFELASGRLPYDLNTPDALKRIQADCGTTLARPITTLTRNPR